MAAVRVTQQAVEVAYTPIPPGVRVTQQAVEVSVLPGPSPIALVFDPATGNWRKWDHIPAGPLVYFPEADTPGVYAGDPAAAKVYRLFEGNDDEGAPIAAYWKDRVRRDVFPGHMLDVTRVEVSVDTGDPDTVIMTATLTPNTKDVQAVSIELPVPGDTDPDTVIWTPPILGDSVRSVQVSVQLQASSPVEITEVAMEIEDRGKP